MLVLVEALEALEGGLDDDAEGGLDDDAQGALSDVDAFEDEGAGVGGVDHEGLNAYSL